MLLYFLISNDLFKNRFTSSTFKVCFHWPYRMYWLLLWEFASWRFFSFLCLSYLLAATSLFLNYSTGHLSEFRTQTRIVLVTLLLSADWAERFHLCVPVYVRKHCQSLRSTLWMWCLQTVNQLSLLWSWHEVVIHWLWTSICFSISDCLSLKLAAT